MEMVPIFQVTLKVAVWAFLSTKYSCEKGDDVIKSWLYAVTTFIVCVILGWAIHTATFVDGHGVEPELTCMWVAPGHGFTLNDALQWRHNESDGVSNHQPHEYFLNHFFRRRSKKTSKLRVTGLCVWNSPVTGEPQRVSDAVNVAIWWRHAGEAEVPWLRG